MTSEQEDRNEEKRGLIQLRSDYIQLRSEFDDEVLRNHRTPLGFVVAATVGIIGWVLVVVLFVWWAFQPTRLPLVTEPLPVLNEEKTVTPGETVIVLLEVAKPENLAVEDTNRFIRCTNGQLITFTASPQDLPPGEYVIEAESPPIPDRVTEPSACELTYLVEYRINPLRTQSVEFTSEPFTILPQED